MKKIYATIISMFCALSFASPEDRKPSLADKIIELPKEEIEQIIALSHEELWEVIEPMIKPMIEQFKREGSVDSRLEAAAKSAQLIAEIANIQQDPAIRGMANRIKQEVEAARSNPANQELYNSYKLEIKEIDTLNPLMQSYDTFMAQDDAMPIFYDAVKRIVHRAESGNEMETVKAFLFVDATEMKRKRASLIIGCISYFETVKLFINNSIRTLMDLYTQLGVSLNKIITIKNSEQGRTLTDTSSEQELMRKFSLHYILNIFPSDHLLKLNEFVYKNMDPDYLDRMQDLINDIGLAKFKEYLPTLCPSYTPSSSSSPSNPLDTMD